MSVPSEDRLSCAICESPTDDAGQVFGRHSKRFYRLARCRECGYALVTDPLLNFAEIYDEAYYGGLGADPLVDYGFELASPERSVRQYEWRGTAQVVSELVGEIAGVRWLDYGCGNGGLVRHLRERHRVEACGFEEGAIARSVGEAGIPLIAREQMEALEGSFDVISAIEVLEHTKDPIAELRTMRSLLRTGGLLFLTTGNARPHAASLSSWSYVVPEIHISFFEPRTLARALRAAGFQPEHRGLGGGFDEILTFKVLKNLGVRRRSVFTDALPRRLTGLLADRMTRLSEHPVGWAVADHSVQRRQRASIGACER